ncbi:pentapeptide repeat-containing protein [Dolichospermum circinale CS-1225]|uniref:Pentapeptide repeat-containing protein n=1 Tax=Dolichospermum circinale CS-537/01 TaxID=3021739 RepID=A0ABT5A2I8_9CYAN|nr:pentapeptide repeat-containing protein [Dolichospermum circinale]MDB9486119.1 pentapeptide repeat-containing protein [Dolichospermum circinale CS-537/01]MDB9523983.1 pentapeptide repeat-containing protein [Dolichospermum circinale CS-1225]
MSTDKSKQQNSFQVDKHLHLQELVEVKELREKFLIIAEISDPLTREYQFALLEKDAEKSGLSAETYRRLYETYLRNHKFIPQYPPKWWIFKEWIEWAANFPKAVLFKKILITALEKGVLIGLISGVFKYYWEAPQREKQTEYQAWTIINNGSGKNVSGGRISALQDLNKNGVELWNLVLDEANLSGIKLENGKLAQTSFKSAILECTQEKCSNLREANLYQAQFQKARLSDIDLQGAVLFKANFEKAYLKKAKLQNSHLYLASLEKAEIPGAKFKGADLENTNFKDAIICGDIFDESTGSTKNSCANFIGAKNLTPEQVKSTKNWEKACYDPELRIKLGLPPDNPDDCQK